MCHGNPPNEHGYCPKCNANFDGGDIVETFIAQGKTPEAARKSADAYGYSKGRTQWGRQIGIEGDHDRIEWWKCPDCGHQWDAVYSKNSNGLFEAKI